MCSAALGIMAKEVERGWGCLLMDVMAASGSGIWLYDRHLHPSRWLKMRSVKLGEMNTGTD